MAKTCFVISPIGDEGSKIRARSDKLLMYVIRDAVELLGYQAVRADEIAAVGDVNDQIVEMLSSADLVVADLTYQNANVFYELAVRHALARPTVHLAERGQEIPFDIAHMGVIFLDMTDLKSVAKAKERISQAALEFEKNSRLISNPVTRALGRLSRDSGREAGG